MSKLNTELFIARRMSSGGPGGGGGSKGVMERIAAATTALSLAVMIVAVGVIAGFRREITGNITAFTGHLQVRPIDYGGSVETAPMDIDPVLEKSIASVTGVRSVAPYALKGGIVKTDDATVGVVLKGVGADYDLSFFERCLVEGTLPRLQDSVRHKDILLSASTARVLNLRVDDRVEILFVGGGAGVGGLSGGAGAGAGAGGGLGNEGGGLGGGVGRGGTLRRDRFRVSGLYSSGLEEMDGRMAFTDIANVRRLNGWNERRITGYEVIIDDMERLDERAGQVAEAISRAPGTPVSTASGAAASDTAGASISATPGAGDRNLMVRRVTDDFPQMFDWLATHDVNAAVIIGVMIVVALVSMISALLIILLERIRMIGILKTLGMNNGSLRRVFVLRSVRILVRGLLAGNILGIGLAVLQQRTGLAKLDAEGYLLSTVPIALDWWWIVALNVGTMAVIVALMIFPTSLVGRIHPDKTLRYQ